MTSKSLSALIDELRLVEREDLGSTREPGSPRAEALAEEIERRIQAIESFADHMQHIGLLNVVYGLGS